MHSQEIEFEIIKLLLPSLKRTFIDVGAEKGSFSQWLLNSGLSGFAIEPMPQHADYLKKLSAAGDLTFLPFAMDAENGQRDLHIATDANGAPLDYFHSLQPLKNDPNIHHTQTLKVECRSLGSLNHEGLIPDHVGILKIDTEGNDLRVLQGIEKVKADLLIVEYFTEGVYEGWSDANPNKLLEKAESLGYSHCIAARHLKTGICQVHYQPLSFSPGEWGNLIFLRENSYPNLRSVLGEKSELLEDLSTKKTVELQQCCDERLKVIETLEAERQRLKQAYEPTD